MTTKDFTANVISASKVVPDGNFKDSKASGVWDINEALDLIKGGNWPNVANINPSAFVDGLFQCHLHTGDGTNSRAIVNNIDFANKGGLFWIKCRTHAESHNLFDTERGATKVILSDATDAEDTVGTTVFESFNNNGVTIGSHGRTNEGSRDYVSWSFRKQPKFFDVVKYTGTGSAQNISHSLGSVPGMIMVKNLDDTDYWAVYHIGADSSSPENYALALNATNARDSSNQYWNNTAPTSSVFTVGTNARTNNNGENYIAYIFANNNDDGGFGEPGDQDIIKCGSFTTPSSGSVTVDLGFEPQWLLVKSTNQTYSWEIYDVMRGLTVNGHKILTAQTSNTEGSNTTAGDTQLTSTGFSAANNYWGASVNLIYVAIRRGGMQTPTAASDVFAIDTSTSDSSSGDTLTSTFPVDAYLYLRRDAGQHAISSRLTETRQRTPNNTAEGSVVDYILFDQQTGVKRVQLLGNASTVDYMWARARGYFDVVTYSGTGSAQNISHNLGVAPEMMWIKRRDSTGSWNVYHKGLNGGTNPEQHVIYLEVNEASNSGGSAVFNNTAPTSSVFTVNTNSGVNNSSGTYIAYLFATAAGVSKVGSFSHTNGSTTDVDCGFTGDTPSFVLLKRYSDTGSWIVFDSTRGIVAGNDPFLDLDTEDAEATGNDVIDPLSGGFQVASGFLATGDWIFYAIAATS